MSDIVKTYLGAALWDLNREAKRLRGDLVREEEAIRIAKERVDQAQTRLTQICAEKLYVRDAALKLNIANLDGE